jgi:hypothetical protein
MWCNLELKYPFLQVPSDRLLFKDYIFRILLLINISEKLIILNFRMPVIHLVFCFIRLQLKINCFAAEKKYLRKLIFYNERWHCYDAHSDLSNGDPIELLNDLNTIIKSTRTINRSYTYHHNYGTAWVYRNNEYVNSCQLS